MGCLGLVSSETFFCYFVKHSLENRVREVVGYVLRAIVGGILLSLFEQILFVSLFSLTWSLAQVREYITFTIWDSGKMTAGLSEE